MHAILALGLTSFLLCLIATPLCRDLFIRFNIVDHPDSSRKLHLKPIPRIGGIPIVVAYVAALALMLAIAPAGAKISIQHSRLLWSLLPAAAIIFLTGLIDDLIGLRPWQKLLGQLIAASLAVSLGARIAMFHTLPFSHWIIIPLSLLWLIGCTNAMNLIDGMDGLATGVGLFATLTTLAAAILSGNLGLAMATVPLAGCLLGFLRYNFSPASIFLGDCGSLTIGFLLGCFGLIWSQHTGSMFGMAAPLMALALPIIDVGLSIGRRFLRSVPIFEGDRGHIHHMILARGFNPRAATLLLYGVCGVAAIFSLLQTFSRIEFRALILLLFCSLVWVGINYLGYIELSAARHTLSRKAILTLLKEEIYLRELKRSLLQTHTTDGCWKIVRTACKDMRFASVQMHLHNEFFQEIFDPRNTNPSWKMTLALGRQGSLVLTRANEDRPPLLMMSVLDHLQESLAKRDDVAAHQSTAKNAHVISGAA